MQKGFVKYIVIIIVILAVVFFSQQEQLLGRGKAFTFIYDAADQAQAYLAKGADWLTANVFPNISGKVQKRGEMIKEGVDQQKEKISESVGEKVKNYFSGITDSVLHPGENDSCNCQTETTQTTSSGQ